MKLTDQEIDAIKQTAPVYVSAKAVNAIVPMVEAKLTARREWVGLTEEEFFEISREYTESFNSGSPDWFDVIKYTGAVEAKLKEKNT